MSFSSLCRTSLVALTLLLTTGCFGTTCTSWVQGGDHVTISQCSDAIERSIDCETKGTKLLCTCSDNGTVTKTFERTEPLPNLPANDSTRGPVVKACGWDFSW